MMMSSSRKSSVSKLLLLQQKKDINIAACNTTLQSSPVQNIAPGFYSIHFNHDAGTKLRMEADGRSLKDEQDAVMI
jgi:hypothetical protein